MDDVARHAGVSMITVSRALSHPEKVSAATRDKIAHAMKEIGYVPNRVAGALASARTRVIAAIVPYIRLGIYADMVQGISDELRKEGYSMLLGTMGMSPNEEEQLLNNLLGLRPAGVIVHGGVHTPGSRNLLRNCGAPVVETGEMIADPIDMVVGFSNYEATRAMVRYLHAQGRRKIGLIHQDPEVSDRGAQRLLGYLDTIRELGLPDEPDLRIQTRVGLLSGARAMSQFLERSPDIDALFCGSDMWAAGAIFECKRQNVAVPERVAIAGCDDQPIAPQIVPAMTTIHLPRYEMGQRAAQMILDCLGELPTRTSVVELDFEIVVRDSA